MENNLPATQTTAKGGHQNYNQEGVDLGLKNLHYKIYTTETNMAQTFGHSQTKC